ncbi:hypothetical protein FS749_006219 [Ceratobasidium sp. UAMH 11750]|nr:hypothetical protein FS749_006219 [Ceratobasidium sp. UAMH 11750]
MADTEGLAASTATGSKRAGRMSLENENNRQKKRKNDELVRGLTSGDDERGGGSATAGGRSESEAEDEAGDRPLSQVWGETMAQFFDRVEETHRRPDATAERIAQMAGECRIGGAIVQALGTGHLAGIVDQAKRANPRPIMQSHVQKLVKAFRSPGAKCDHQSPVLLMISRKRIEPSCLQIMSSCDARDPTAVLPLLALADESSEEILRLEKMLMSQQEGGAWLSAGAVREVTDRLESLYNGRERALLLNGNHRVEAIKELGRSFKSDFRDLLERVKSGKVKPDKVKEAMWGSDMMKKVLLASYRVEVYDADLMPEELLNWLARNDDSKPSQGMGPGEHAWWTAGRFDALAKRAAADGVPTKEEQYGWAYAEWVRERGAPGDVSAPKPKPVGRRRGDWVGANTVSRLFTEPFTMEMVRDTRNAGVAYDRHLKQALSVSMVQPGGGVLACHFWLSARTLLEIFDVEEGGGLEGALAYVSHNQTVTSLGDRSASKHWELLHSRPQARPRLLEHYTSDVSKRFDDLYCAAWERAKHPSRGIEWDSDPTVLRFRNVFDSLGRWLLGRTHEWCKRVGVSLCLYARLPLQARDYGGPAFTPSAALPAERWLALVQERQKVFNSECGMIIVTGVYSGPVSSDVDRGGSNRGDFGEFGELVREVERGTSLGDEVDRSRAPGRSERAAAQGKFEW